MLLPDLAADILEYAVETRVPLEGAIGDAIVLTMPEPSRGGTVVQTGLATLDGREDDPGGSVAEARSLAAALAAGYAAAGRRSRRCTPDRDHERLRRRRRRRRGRLSSTLGSGSGSSGTASS